MTTIDSITYRVQRFRNRQRIPIAPDAEHIENAMRLAERYAAAMSWQTAPTSNGWYWVESIDAPCHLSLCPDFGDEWIVERGRSCQPLGGRRVCKIEEPIA